MMSAYSPLEDTPLHLKTVTDYLTQVIELDGAERHDATVLKIKIYALQEEIQNYREEWE
jgi:hypothetical protein